MKQVVAGESGTSFKNDFPSSQHLPESWNASFKMYHLIFSKGNQLYAYEIGSTQRLAYSWI